MCNYMLIKFLFVVIILIDFNLQLAAQVKIGNNPATINTSSLLELESINKGFVPPRLSLTSLTSVSPLSSNALNGTIVFNTNNTFGNGLYYWDSTNVKWIAITPITASGNTNYIAKWNSPTSLGSSSVLYESGSNIGLNTTTPSANLDVNGTFKLGNLGSVNKNIVNFSASITGATIPTGFSAITIVGISVISFNTNNDYVDVTITTPSTFTTAQGVVFASPASGNNLPNGVSIASAKLSSPTQVKIRFLNSSTSAQTVSGDFNIMVATF